MGHLKKLAEETTCRKAIAILLTVLTLASTACSMESQFDYANLDPGPVNFVNVKTEKCVTVRDGSVVDNADVVQSSCIDSENQRFWLHPVSESAGFFQIRPAHVTGQNMCVAVVVASLKQKSCGSSSLGQTFGLDSVSVDTWTVKRKNLSRSCWTVPETNSSGRAVTPSDGTELVNVFCAAASRTNQVWRIQRPEGL